MPTAEAKSVGRIPSSIPRSLQNAKIFASAKLCVLHEEIPSLLLQNANMDAADKLAGFHLKAWRDHRRMSQEALAKAVGTTGSVISLFEMGERKLAPKWLAKLGPALGIKPGFLLDHLPDELDNDIIEIWGAIEPAKREHAKEILNTFRTGTEG